MIRACRTMGGEWNQESRPMADFGISCAGWFGLG